MAIQIIAFLSYIPSFLKLHIEYFKPFKFAQLHWIGTGTLVIAYGIEILSEICKVFKNPIKVPTDVSLSEAERSSNK